MTNLERERLERKFKKDNGVTIGIYTIKKFPELGINYDGYQIMFENSRLDNEYFDIYLEEPQHFPSVDVALSVFKERIEKVGVI